MKHVQCTYSAHKCVNRTHMIHTIHAYMCIYSMSMYIMQHACTEACNIHFTELKLALSRKHISMPVFFLAFQDPNSAPEYQQVMTVNGR